MHRVKGNFRPSQNLRRLMLPWQVQKPNAPVASSEIELRSELDLSRCTRGCAANPAKYRACNCGRRQIERGVIQQIGDVGAQLEAKALGQTNILGERRVHIDEGRSAVEIAAGVAKIARDRR